jgi:tRNA(Ile)-lysidine synthase
MASSRKSASASVRAALASLGVAGPARPLAVAFSGGLDSTVLLDACCAEAGAEAVFAIHVHHGLQAAAEDWAAPCGAQALRLGARYVALRVEGGAAAGDSVEAWARGQRYRLLLQAARDAGALALLTAHHADDQLETVLMALERGSGLDGLTGIAARDRREGVVLVRPLLAMTRAELLAEARDRGLEWIEDPSNEDEAFLRNAVRRRVLPVLADVLPRLPNRLADTLALLAQAREVLDGIAASDLAGASPPDRSGELDRRAFAPLPPARQANALRAWVARLGEPPPSRAKLEAMHAQLIRGVSAYAEVVHGETTLVRYRDRLLAWRAAPVSATAPPPPVALRWDGRARLAVPGFGGWLRFEPSAHGERCGVDRDWLLAAALSVEPGRPAARLRPRPEGPSRTLKNLFQEHGVPAPLRPWFPMVLAEGRLLTAAPFGMDCSPDWPRRHPEAAVTLRWEPPAAHDPRASFAAVHKV